MASAAAMAWRAEATCHELRSKVFERFAILRRVPRSQNVRLLFVLCFPEISQRMRTASPFADREKSPKNRWGGLFVAHTADVGKPAPVDRASPIPTQVFLHPQFVLGTELWRIESQFVKHRNSGQPPAPLERIEACGPGSGGRRSFCSFSGRRRC